ncbi:NUDIX hydrolase [Rhizobium tubonense]|uniref:DNA mismatch repair protein MutT n=1 Tax=Rhizobium tubonense TaxID=484088 RepID=A0A2W4C7N8_9HYPH|nr:NUDIX hydrolase [Rhizobium tubonense]PZM08961.1 DNA mismatch repair protein MutT [Rhizobium tubonense]
MSKDGSLLARLAAYTDMMMRGESFEQFGAICFRIGSDGCAEVLLVTTRETRRWTIPKGWPIKGLKAHEVAEREAWEEAGVKGKVKKKPAGYYTYLKTLDGGNRVPAMVEVHLLAVDTVFDKFPEYKERTIEWMSPFEAASRVDEPELKGLLGALVSFSSR